MTQSLISTFIFLSYNGIYLEGHGDDVLVGQQESYSHTRG